MDHNRTYIIGNFIARSLVTLYSYSVNLCHTSHGVAHQCQEGKFSPKVKVGKDSNAALPSDKVLDS